MSAFVPPSFRVAACAAVLLSACASSPTTSGQIGSGGSSVSPGSGGQAQQGTGGTGTGGARAIVMKTPADYPHNSAGAKYPYPQGHASSSCAFPVYNTDKIRDAYVNWKAKFFQGGRVVRPSTDAGADTANPNDTVSEGIGYGMLIGVYLNDRPLFDALWSYAQAHFDGNGLMHWRIGQGGNVISQGSATDADEDMAWALLMAAAQWGGSYSGAAATLINNIWNHAIDVGGGYVLKPGDNFGGASLTNPSYFAPSYYRAFATATNNSNWMKVVDSSYTILAASSGTNGLVPNWTNAQGGAINGPNNDTNGPYFGYDACRTPWRIALDYCETGEPRAKSYLDKAMTFFMAQGLGLKDGYTTAGANPPGSLGDYGAGMSLLGPVGVAAAIPGHEIFLGQLYDVLESATTSPAKMNISGVFTYYHASLGVLSLMTLSGNFWHLTP